MLSTALIVLPDFGVILLGILLARKLGYTHDFWQVVEKLVYFILFPPLLFHSVATSRFSLGEASTFLFCGFAAMLGAVLLSWILCRACELDDSSRASAFQCNFRFNSYIGFALTLNMYGKEGFALFALFMAFWVPVSSAIAVTALAKASAGKGATFIGVIREIVRNPLIIATVAGLLWNLTGLGIFKPIDLIFTRLGNASLALGLLAIGAALRFETIQGYKAIVTGSTLLRLVIVPVLCLIVCRICGLENLATGVLLIFTALPTANSCYILAVRMSGNGPLVAAITTAQTLAAIITMPVILTMGQLLFGL